MVGDRVGMGERVGAVERVVVDGRVGVVRRRKLARGMRIGRVGCGLEMIVAIAAFAVLHYNSPQHCHLERS